MLLLLQQKLQDFLKEKGFTDEKYTLPAIIEKDGSAGFDVDGKIQAKIEFDNGTSNRDSTAFEFFVNRAGDDPMVTMNVHVKEEYGQHGCSQTFEVTLNDKKSIKYDGW